LILLLVLIVLLFGGHIVFETLRVMNSEANPSVDYRAQQRDMALQRLGFDEDRAQAAEEAWSLLMDALAEMNRVVTEFNAEIAAVNPEPRWEFDGPQVDFLMAQANPRPRDLRREREAILRLREAGVFEKSTRFADSAPGLARRQHSGMLIGLLLPELSTARQFAQARLASATFALEEGDHAEAAQAYREIFAIAHTLGLQETLISWLVDVAISTMALNELRAVLNEHDFDEPFLHSILDALNRYEMPPVAHALESERIAFLDTVQWMFSDNGEGDGYLLPSGSQQLTGIMGAPMADPGMPAFVTAFFARFQLATRAETVTAYHDMMDDIIAAANKPRTEREGALDAHEAALDAMARDRRNILIAALMPAVARVIDSDHIARVMFEGTRLFVAVELFRARHGRLPESLDDLTPDILPQLPADLTHGGPFVYRILDEPDAQGRDYLLYSTGYDKTDNGGTQVIWWKNEGERHRDMFSALKDPDVAGYDYLINQTRDELNPPPVEMEDTDTPDEGPDPGVPL